MMLEEIMRRQALFAEQIKKQQEEAAKAPKKAKAPKTAVTPAEVSAAAPKEAKIVGVPVPLEQHLRMEALIKKTSKTAGGARSKKEILLRALENYLNNFDIFEKLASGVTPTPKADEAVEQLQTKLEKAGYQGFFIGVGVGELIVYHQPTVSFTPGALPKTCNGYLVRAQPSTVNPASVGPNDD